MGQKSRSRQLDIPRMTFPAIGELTVLVLGHIPGKCSTKEDCLMALAQHRGDPRVVAGQGFVTQLFYLII